MEFKKISCLFIVLIGLLTSCSGGTNGGGGNGNDGGTPPGGSLPLTYNKADLEGTWSWNAVLQSGSATLTGTMTFDGEVRLIDYEPDRCPGSGVLYPEFWIWEDGFVKGRHWNFCGDTTAHVKYGVYFQGSEKKLMTGIMDLHYLLKDGTETYDRFDITLNKQTSSRGSKGLIRQNRAKITSRF
jgi:hypothetical protein